MNGKPKFNYEDKVKFTFGEKVREGTIYIIDKYGTLEDSSNVSYDIMSEYEGRPCLFKHIREDFVEAL